MTTEKGSELLNTLYSQYKNSSLLMRGSDGQVPTNITGVLQYIDDTFDGSNNSGLENPWSDFIKNIAPAYSTSLVSHSALYPILWYFPQYSNIFVTLNPPVDASSTPIWPLRKDGHLPHSRNEFSFIIKKGKFLGNSLWDGNSNGDVNSNVTIPTTSNVMGNRGTSISSYSAELPYSIDISGSEVSSKPLGNSKWNQPDSNNTNKSFNPTFIAKNDGLPLPFQEYDVHSNQSNINSKIFKNLTSIKGKIWQKYIETKDLNNLNIKDPKSWPPNVLTVINNLNKNFGSGFEIEGYTFPPQYNENSSPWENNDDKNSNNYYSLKDMYCMSISTDMFNIHDFIKTYSKKNLEDAFKNLIEGATQSSSKWIHKPSQNIMPLVLITNMMLPKVNLEDAKSDPAQELVQYIINKTKTGKSCLLQETDFNLLGQVKITVIGKTQKYEFRWNKNFYNDS